jgi:phosphate-selective porin O/P
MLQGLACGLLLCGSLHAGEPRMDGYVQIWATLHEELENGLRQAGSGQTAQQEVSGFSLRRVRISLQDTLGTARTSFRIEALLEKSARLTDCYLTHRLTDAVEVRLGQMKVPSTYEAMDPNRRIDFITRTSVSTSITDWSLSRTPYISSFMGNRAYLRDLGAGVVFRGNHLELFAMVGNGLGANLFVGGHQHREYVLTNGLGNWLYAARVDVGLTDRLRVGGHALLNRHENMLLNDQRTVVDLHRRSGSVDSSVELPCGMRLTGLFALGVVDDDYFRDGRTNYAYRGYEAKLMGWIRPGWLEAGARFDRFVHEFNESGHEITQDDWTLGLNCHVGPQSKLQLNYLRKATDEAYEQDLADNALRLSAQFEF